MHAYQYKLFVAVTLLLCTCALPLSSQTTYGAIVGTARDGTGAVMAGVKVTVTNQATGVSLSQNTNEAGAYAFTTLYPGTYLVRAEFSGFRPVDIRGISLSVNQTARFDLNMELGQVAERIEVLATLPVLATDTSDVGQVINNRQIMELPLNGRNFMQLASLTNNVILTGNVEGGGPNFLSQGGRPTQNSFLVEGVESRIQREGGYGLNLSVEAIQEFKVMQNSFAAEYGRATTIVNAAIKSGGNQIHGSVFEFLRNEKLDSRNAFDLSGAKRPPLRMNQFGASIGGPILKDKLFYFANYEGQRVRRGFTAYANVPTPAQFDGNLADLRVANDPTTGQPFPNNVVPASRISQYAKAARAYYPAPTGSPIANQNFMAVITNPVTMNQGTARIDYQLSERDRFNSHLTFFKFQRVNYSAMPFAGSQGSSDVRPNMSVQWTHTFSPRLLNDFRYGYSFTDTYIGPDRLLDKDVTKEFGLQNLSPEPDAYAPPQTNIAGFSSVGSGAWIPQGAYDTAHMFVEQLTLITGKHTLKFGGDLRYLQYDDRGYATQNGYYTFTHAMYSKNSMADFLLGLPQEVFANQPGGRGFLHYMRNGEYSFYAQDDWKVTRELTVNAGLRYEYVQWPYEVNDELSVWNFQRGNLDRAGREIPRRLIRPDKNNFSPRLGFAYSPSWLKRTVFRAGSGMMYSNFRQWEISLFHFNPPFVFDRFQFNDLPNPSFTTSTLWPATSTDLSSMDFRTVTVNYQGPDKVLPYTFQWNFNIEHELMPNLLVEVGYVGNRSMRQPNRWDANPAAPYDPANPRSIQERRPYQNVGFVSGNTSRAWSNFNGLNFRVERRFSRGLSLLSVYSWSKAMAIRPHDNWTVMEINNIRLNYGPVNDFRHRATFSYVWDLPVGRGRTLLPGVTGWVSQVVSGWQVNGITTIRSGAALSTSSPTSNGLGNRAGNRPDRVKDGNLPVDERTTERWFDTTALVNPEFGRYGNAGDGILRGPGAVNWDLSLFKNFELTERTRLQFRWENFNAFNNVNLANPSTNTGDARFGRVTGAATAREMQFGLKLLF
jgi:hypothetical protein